MQELKYESGQRKYTIQKIEKMLGIQVYNSIVVERGYLHQMLNARSAGGNNWPE